MSDLISKTVKSLTNLHWQWGTYITTCSYPHDFRELTIGSRIEITIRDEISGNNSSVHATIKMLRYDQPYIIGNEESKIIRNILVKEHPHNGHQYQEITKLDNVPMYWIDVDRANIGKCVLGSNQVIFIDGTNAAIYSDADEQIDYYTKYRMTGKALWCSTNSSIFRVNCDDN